jgi:hypothetical protein
MSFMSLMPSGEPSRCGTGNEDGGDDDNRPGNDSSPRQGAPQPRRFRGVRRLLGGRR